MPGRVYKRGNRWITEWGGRQYTHTSKTLAQTQLRLLYGIKRRQPTNRKR